MSLDTLLNVVISLLFLFLLLSMIATVFQELVAGAWNSRGRGLKAAVSHLLGDPKGTGLASRFYAHKLVAGMAPPGIDWRRFRWLRRILPFVAPRLPSYLPKEIFADVLIDILKSHGALRTGNMQPGLRTLWRASGASEGVIRLKLLDWFEAMADRQSGIYKRSVQRRLFLYGLVVAAALNVDTIRIAQDLWESGNKAHVVEIAGRAAEFHAGRTGIAPPASAGKGLEQLPALVGELRSLRMPIGWGGADACTVASGLSPGWLDFWPFSGIARAVCPAPPEKPIKPITLVQLLGWIMTAFAVSLGAQFWFDTLGKVVGLRSSGRKPDP